MVDKLRVWTAHPGWRPPGLPPYPQPTPITRAAQAKYAPTRLPGSGRYVALQFGPVVVAVTLLLLVEHDTPAWLLALAAGLVVWTVWGWGALFERRPAAVPSEALRLGAVAATGAGLAAGGWLPSAVGAGIVAFAALSVVVLARLAPGASLVSASGPPPP
ncbi:MAG: hypothetical protein R3F59_37575 [Myxococcota bacterium]